MTWDTKADGFKHVDVLLEEIVKRVESLDEVQHGGDARGGGGGSPAHGASTSTSTDAGESFSRMRRRSTTNSSKLANLL